MTHSRDAKGVRCLTLPACAALVCPAFLVAGGRVAAIAVDPRDQQHWLIGAAQGGIWETRDAGTTWTAKTDAAPSLAMGKIAFAPSDPNIIYAGTGEAVSGGFSYGGAGILKSVDSGATWQQLGAATFSGAAFSALRLDPNDPRVVVAATATTLFDPLVRNQRPLTLQTGIFNSSDGGATWFNTLIGHASALEVDPGNFSRQFAGIGAYSCADGPPIPTASATSTVTPTASSTHTLTPTALPSATPSPSPSVRPTASPTAPPTRTLSTTPTAAPTVTATGRTASSEGGCAVAPIERGTGSGWLLLVPLLWRRRRTPGCPRRGRQA
jgi:hypothetical protein